MYCFGFSTFFQWTHHAFFQVWFCNMDWVGINFFVFNIQWKEFWSRWSHKFSRWSTVEFLLGNMFMHFMFKSQRNVSVFSRHFLSMIQSCAGSLITWDSVKIWIILVSCRFHDPISLLPYSFGCKWVRKATLPFVIFTLKCVLFTNLLLACGWWHLYFLQQCVAVETLDDVHQH